MAKTTNHTYDIKMGQLEHFFEKSWLWVINLAYGRGRPGGGGRLNADNCGQGGGGQKLAKFCGRLLWMAPYQYHYCGVFLFTDLRVFFVTIKIKIK